MAAAVLVSVILNPDDDGQWILNLLQLEQREMSTC